MLNQDATTVLRRIIATKWVVTLGDQRCFGDDADTSQYQYEQIEFPAFLN